MIENKRQKRIISLNYLGGIAILMVILVHTSQQISGFYFSRYLAMYGMMGVQIFFFTSGFGLALSADKSESFQLKTFYHKRISKIAPGYYFGIFLYFGIYLLLSALNLQSKTGYNYTPFNILINIFFLNGLVPSANNNIVPGGWSISTIVMFYILFPFIYKLYNKKHNFYKYAPFVATLLSILFNVVMSQTSIFYEDPIFFYNHILNQLPVFLIGMSSYFAFRNGDLFKIKKVTSILFFLFFTGISGLLLMFGAVDTPIFNTLAPISSGISYLFLFVFLQFHFTRELTILSNISKFSYTMYLIHFIFAVYLSSFLYNLLQFIPGDILLIPLFVMSVALSYFTAKKIHAFVNTPFHILLKQKRA